MEPLKTNLLSKPHKALTIAGFDPAGDAGVLADAKTFAAFGLDAAAVITSLTFQNRSRMSGASHQSGENVRAQVSPLLGHYKIICAKTGMLPTREVVVEVARLFRETELPSPVVDPVLVSTSGHSLMEEDALEFLLSDLLPLARLVTPNIPEAEKLSGLRITSEREMRRAAAIIRGLGAPAVLIKGGHLDMQRAGVESQKAEDKLSGMKTDMPAEATDVLDNEGKVTVFRESRVHGAGLHGSGCMLSAAIAAGLGREMSLEDAVRMAKSFVWEAINKAGQTFRNANS